MRNSLIGIAPLDPAQTWLGNNLGFEMRIRVGVHPKICWRTSLGVRGCEPRDSEGRVNARVLHHSSEPGSANGGN